MQNHYRHNSSAQILPTQCAQATLHHAQSPKSADLLWEALEVTHLLAGLGVVDSAGLLVAGTLVVGDGWRIVLMKMMFEAILVATGCVLLAILA